jgi:hypothetical protein
MAQKTTQAGNFAIALRHVTMLMPHGTYLLFTMGALVL